MVRNMKKLLILGIAALALTACTDTKVPFLSSKSGNTNSSSNASEHQLDSLQI